MTTEGPEKGMHGGPDSRAGGLLVWRIGLSVALFAVLCLQIAILMRPVSPAPPKPSYGNSQPSVFLDDRGRPVYPYVLREAQNTVTKNAAALQKCYLDYLGRSPQVRDGKMTFDWYVNPEGRAEMVEFVSGALGDEPMKAAIKAAVEKMRFPTPGDKTYVEYTFIFKDVTVGTEKP